MTLANPNLQLPLMICPVYALVQPRWRSEVQLSHEGGPHGGLVSPWGMEAGHWGDMRPTETCSRLLSFRGIHCPCPPASQQSTPTNVRGLLVGAAILPWHHPCCSQCCPAVRTCA